MSRRGERIKRFQERFEERFPTRIEWDRTTALRLWQSALGLAKAMARKRASIVRPFLGECQEDLEQAALLGLWNAACSYDPSKGKFPTFAWNYIRGELQCERWRLGFWGFNGERAQYQQKAKLRLRSPLSDIPEKEVARKNIRLDELDNKELLEFLIRQLRPQKAQLVAKSYWLDGKSTQEIARELLVSVDRIEQIRAKARKDLEMLALAMKRIWKR